MNGDSGKVTLCKTVFGKWKNPKTESCETVDKFIWKTVNRFEVSLITFGASLIEIKAPDRDGKSEDILMGYYNLENYLRDEKYFFGSTTGPISGVIKNGRFCLKGKLHHVGKNYKQVHCLNSAEKGFNRINWNSFVDGTDVILSHATEGSKSFPGIILVQILFSVKANNTLTVKTTARSNQVTPIDISTQMYFNLASHDGGVSETMDHLVTVNSKQICEKYSEGFSEVKEISSDFNLGALKKIGDIIKKSQDETINCVYVVDKHK